VAEGLCCAGLYVERRKDLPAALARARQTAGPAVVCVRTDRDANLAVPQESLMRFVEVYRGQMG
jgi:thiamine pyrophosphate-dependent acetolactate synthase large subunit-like protein